MMGRPVLKQEAIMYLELWGKDNCIGGPKAYPKVSAHVPVARGKDADWTINEVEIVGQVVKRYLEEGHEAIVKLYYVPQSDGKRLRVNAICKKTGLHHRYVNEVISYCEGRVAMALSMPQYLFFQNNV